MPNEECTCQIGASHHRAAQIRAKVCGALFPVSRLLTPHTQPLCYDITDCSVMSDFGEKIRPIDSIKGILASYPFSVGIFRELLQNSDDAGATEQVRLLRAPPLSNAFAYSGVI